MEDHLMKSGKVSCQTCHTSEPLDVKYLSWIRNQVGIIAGAENYANIAEISVKEAQSECNADEWQRAIQDEFSAMIKNGTRELTEQSKYEKHV